ncbi:hydrogenase expression/formation protein HypE [Corynebacterium mendelii]|uniref:Hydrogenase expression/formation protein HypE n=1 Tax=Corynebacterium mendelii TaxID=2765362 RepID=A0A939DZN9_9CORY|nr:hydrogenase expression/formation protein HypE [Corynebacterium mendelii]MBN9643993.1 hydrogenase expression/formation protein HypE [Corynebacterium mendelii]
MDPKNRLNDDEKKVNSNISRVRSRPHRLTDSYVTLAHGAGGKASAALVEQVFYPAFDNDILAQGGDSGVVDASLIGEITGRIAMSTDSYVVNPIEFPGGTIGELAVNGTVNDIAVAGGQPKVITAAFVLEEGLDIATLTRIVKSMREAADTAGVTIIAGDTKVVPKGACDRLYITTAGIGVIPEGRDFGYHRVEEGDRIICSGPIADHGMAVMMARGDLAMTAPIQSDTRAVNALVDAVCAAAPDTRWMRDATRGGLATVMNELARGSGKGVALDDGAIRVRELTRGACDVLGIDPLYVANEGTFTAVVPAEQADAAVAALHSAGADQAGVIGRIVAEPAESVVLVTGFGGTRMVDMLVGDPLPRIC